MYVVLMAGGVGTRFWPMSRQAYPKQFLKFSGSKTMLQRTYERIKPLTTDDKIIVVTNLELIQEVKNQLPGLPQENIIGEPEGKNTAPCIGLAATIIQSRSGDDAVMVVLPADHLVFDLPNFRKTLKAGAAFARQNKSLITMGITPTYPETGYGYIQTNEKVRTLYGKDIYRVRTFAEKPNIETANRFIKSGDFLWNSGMFIWSVRAILGEIDEHLPELANDLNLLRPYIGKVKFKKLLKEVYARTKSVSIDYGIMEVARDVCVIRSDFDWNDLGSWEAVYNISPKDKAGNVCTSRKEIMLDSSNNYFHAPKKLIAASNVDGLIVIDMDDALLICTKENSQNVKFLVDQLKKRKMKDYL